MRQRTPNIKKRNFLDRLGLSHHTTEPLPLQTVSDFSDLTIKVPCCKSTKKMPTKLVQMRTFARLCCSSSLPGKGRREDDENDSAWSANDQWIWHKAIVTPRYSIRSWPFAAPPAPQREKISSTKHWRLTTESKGRACPLEEAFELPGVACEPRSCSNSCALMSKIVQEQCYDVLL